MRRQRMAWVRKTAGMILFWLLLLALLLITVLNILGFSLYIVTSGSMEPAISTGSTILTGPVSFSKLKEGDVITYRLPAGNLAVTHRIVMIDQETKKIRTKGDANAAPDAAAVSEEQILGKVYLDVSCLNPLFRYLASKEGKISAAGLALLCLLAGWADLPELLYKTSL